MESALNHGKSAFETKSDKIRPPRAGLLGLQLSVLSLCVLIIYYPAVYQPPRADQLIYFFVTSDAHSFFQLTFGTFALNRSGLVGDTILFRPALYWFLGLEKWAFGYDFTLWQLTNIFLHISIVIALLLLLRRVTGQAAISFVSTLFFACNVAGTEMVAWSHISGYLLFCLFSLLALYFFQCLEDTGQRLFGWLLICVTALSALTYELGNILSLLLAAAIAFGSYAKERDKADYWPIVGALAAIPILFTAWSVGDLYTRFGTIALSHLPRNDIMARDFQTGMAAAFGDYIAHWLASGLLPALVNISVGERMTSGPLIIPAGFLDFLNVALAVVVGILFTASAIIFYRHKTRELAGLSVVIVATILAISFTLTVVLGRGAFRGYSGQLFFNSYYAYIFLLYAIIPLSTFIGWLGCDRETRIRNAAITVLFSLAVISALKVYNVQERMRFAYSEPRRLLLDSILAARAATSADGPFAFSVAPSCPVNEVLPWFPRRAPGQILAPAQSGADFTLAYVLWPHSYRATGSKVEIGCPYRKPSP